jgi:hypothetical protein
VCQWAASVCWLCVRAVRLNCLWLVEHSPPMPRVLSALARGMLVTLACARHVCAPAIPTACAVLLCSLYLLVHCVPPSSVGHSLSCPDWLIGRSLYMHVWVHCTASAWLFLCQAAILDASGGAFSARCLQPALIPTKRCTERRALVSPRAGTCTCTFRRLVAELCGRCSTVAVSVLRVACRGA